MVVVVVVVGINFQSGWIIFKITGAHSLKIIYSRRFGGNRQNLCLLELQLCTDI